MKTITKRLNQNNDLVNYTRTLQAHSSCNGFQGKELYDSIGSNYTFVFWHLPGSNLSKVQISPDQYKANARVDQKLKATIVTVPVSDVHTVKGVQIAVSVDGDV